MPIRLICQVVSVLALVGTILPSVLFFADQLTLRESQAATLVATLVWFAAATIWMGPKGSGDQDSSFVREEASV